MKKILLSAFLLVAASVVVADANAQSFQSKAFMGGRKQAFYYYPGANVYYDVASRQYIYSHGGVWMRVPVLPREFIIVNEPRHTVYHYGPNVWADNYEHERIYRRNYRQQKRMMYEQARVYQPGVQVIVRAGF